VFEWGEWLGADILSSSIGYIDWYSQNDLDGSTARITQAVNIAIELGMVVVTAVGNSGPGGIVAPADAFDVISCGAVDGNGIIASFSSLGPTADGRIKPEVCALGMGTFTATADSTTSYETGEGTSLAAPVISGACALLLEAHPDWTPFQIRNAILNTADQSNIPNNTYGWGIVDAVAALNYDKTETPSDSIFFISNGYPNPSDRRVTFTLNNPPESAVAISIIDVEGASIFGRNVTLSQKENILNLNLKNHPSGIYFVVFTPF
jgi:subtilisin family serine protease